MRKLSSKWSQNEAEIFSKDSVITEVLKSPIQRERIEVALTIIGTGNVVLDIGAGDGGISELIRSRGNEVMAMDFPEVIQTIPKERDWLKRYGHDAALEPYPIETESVDVVFAGELVEHFIDVKPFFRQVHRILKKDGKLVLTTPNVARALNRVAMLTGVVDTWHEVHKPIHHIRYYTPATLKETVKSNGFQPVEWGFGRSLAEGTELGFNVDWLSEFSPLERKVVIGIINKFCPEPVWRHSFIILGSRKVEIG